MIQKRCGVKKRGNTSEGLPFAGATLKEIGAAATRSLKGEGKNQMTPTYGTVRFNQKPETRNPRREQQP